MLRGGLWLLVVVSGSVLRGPVLLGSVLLRGVRLVVVQGGCQRTMLYLIHYGYLRRRALFRHSACPTTLVCTVYWLLVSMRGCLVAPDGPAVPMLEPYKFL